MKHLDILLEIFPSEPEKTTVETVCGIRVKNYRLMNQEAFLADKGANQVLWCPHCFGGS